MYKRILFQGDSITDARRDREAADNCCGPDMGYGYVSLIAAELMKKYADQDFTCLNRGISGNRIVDLYARWKRDALNLKPDLISILIGVNDVWHEVSRKDGVEPGRFEQIYRMLLDWTLEVLPEVKLVLCEPFVLISESVDTSFFANTAERADIVRRLAEDYNAVFVPLQQALSDAAERAGDAGKILLDGVHPKLAGAKIIADKWLEKVGI